MLQQVATIEKAAEIFHAFKYFNHIKILSLKYFVSDKS